MSAIQDYANGMVEIELASHRKYRPEQLAKVSPEDIERYRQSKIVQAEQLASDIRNHSPKIVERIATGLLHPDNKLSRAVFSEVTGIALPSTVGGTDRVIQASNPWGQLLVDYWAEYRKQRDAKQAELENARQAKLLESVNRSIESLKANNPISGDELVDVAKHLGLAPHIRTIGTLRKRVVSIRPGQCRIAGGNVPDGVWQLLNSVMSALTETEPCNDELVKALFGK